jgi:hypothetical protein
MSDKFKLGILAYVAPRGLANADAFFANIRNFPTKHELVIYSDNDYSKEWPGMTKLNGTVEVAKTDTNRMAVNNLVFFTGLRIAANRGFTHVLILEHDCRVGVAGWDEIIWQEFLSKNPEAIMGGSLVVFNPCSFSRKGAELFEELLIGTKPKRFLPLSVFGPNPPGWKRISCVFPNGCFAIYRMDWLLKTFPEITGTPEQYIGLSMKLKTWDYAIGFRLWQEFNEDTYGKVVHLDSAYSGYGNILSTEEERKQWVSEGKIVGVHQIKSDWTGPEPKPMKDLAPPPKLEADIPPVAVPALTPPRCGLLWVTYGKDFEWFVCSAKSYNKFAHGWSRAMCVVPKQDEAQFRPVCEACNVELKPLEEWPDKPFNWHQLQKCCADIHLPDCDIIYHLDADSVFAQSCMPDDWIVGGKVLMPYTPYSAFLTRPVDVDEAATFQGFTGKKIDFSRGQYNWKFAVEFALGHEVERECMAWQPIAHWRFVYEMARKKITERYSKIGFDGYVRSCRDTHPQTFCEFNTLGAIAHKYFEDKYEWWNLQGHPYPFLGKVIQSHSHSGWDAEHDYGNQITDKTINTPRKLMISLGLKGMKPGRPRRLVNQNH